MTAPTLWFVIAAILIGAEMLTGTFYLLVFSLACVAAAVAALVGLPPALQYGIAALIAIAGAVWLRRHPMGGRKKREQSLDIGRAVAVEEWKTDKLVRVRYRGTGWDGELLHALPQRPDQLFIQAQRGNLLILNDKSPDA